MTAASRLRARPTPRLVRALALGLPFLLLAPIVRGVVLLVLAWDLLLLALFLADGRRLRRSARLRFQRDAPARFSVGVWNPVGLRAESAGAGALTVHLEDGFPDDFDVEPGPRTMALAPSGAATLAYRVRPRQRGTARFGDLTVAIEGRAGLAALAGVVPLQGDVRVYPDLGALRRSVLGGARLDLAAQGSRKLHRAGSGDELDQLRDYVPGDDFRAIEWKATARRSKPITRVTVAERSQRVLIAIDCGRAMAARAGELSRLDVAINAALVLAHVALAAGDLVGLTVFSSEVHASIPAGRGRAHFGALVETLQGVRERLVFVDHRALARALVRRGVRRGLVVLYTDLLDEASARPLVDAFRVLARRHAALVVAPSDPVVLAAARARAASREEVFQALAAREALAERHGVLERVRRLGVEVVDTPAAALGLAAVNRYLEIKRRRRI